MLSNKTKRTLELEGWEVISEEPLAVREKITDSIATKLAAAMVIDYLKKKRREERKAKTIK